MIVLIVLHSSLWSIIFIVHIGYVYLKSLIVDLNVFYIILVNIILMRMNALC